MRLLQTPIQSSPRPNETFPILFLTLILLRLSVWDWYALVGTQMFKSSQCVCACACAFVCCLCLIEATSHQECSKDICSTLELYHSNGSCQERCQTTGIRPSAAPLKYITNEAGADECKVPLTNDPLIYRTHRLATSIVYDGFSSCNACIAHLCDKTNRTLSMPRLSAEYCNRPNAYLRTEAALCYSRQQQLLVRQPKTTGQPFPLGTLPVWLFFQSASTSCYKVINEKVLYFNGNCSRELIVEEVQKRSVPLNCVLAVCSIYLLRAHSDYDDNVNQ